MQPVKFVCLFFSDEFNASKCFTQVDAIKTYSLINVEVCHVKFDFKFVVLR